MNMAREGRIRKLHRRDWPGFLNRVIPSRVWQDFWGEQGSCGQAGVRWTSKYVVLCWLAMGWSLQPQLTERFREGKEFLAGLFPSRRRSGRSYQGLVKATQRVGPEVFHRFWHGVRATLPKRLGPRWRWHGWTVLAADGSRIDAPRTRRNERSLGRAGRVKTRPQWWITFLAHLPTLSIWDWRQGPGTTSERAHLRQMIGTLPQRALLIMDAGFGGFDFLWDLTRSGVRFLVRCASNTTVLAGATRQTIERCGGHEHVCLWPTDRRSRTPLCLRLIVLKRGGRRVYLLTNVMASTSLSRSIAGEFYRARWGVEVNYRSLKQTLERAKVLARSPDAGRMELAGSVLALALLLLQGAVALGARVVELSVAAALRIVRKAIEAIRHNRSSHWFVGRLRGAVRDHYERRSSKRARDWPRKKVEPPPSPPKIRKPNQREKTRIKYLLAASEPMSS